MQENTYNPCDDCLYGYSKQNQESTMCRICEFKKYRDLEEQGLLLRLPCKVGDEVYTLDYIYECDCGFDCVELDAYKCEEDLPCEHQYKVYRVRKTQFQNQMIVLLDKTVFLTKAEAEEALKKMEEHDE